MDSGKLPSIFKRAKILALLKPKKPADDPKSYRPIALLSVCLKLLERLILNRIGPPIEAIIPKEQAGFRPKRSCTDQVLALTNFIEEGFQKRMKTAVTFVDLTAAYDTVWKMGVIFKLMKVIPCLKLCDLVCSILSDRLINVYLNNSRSNTKKLNNGLPQGSVLAPSLFNLYIHDLPPTTCRKFNYADDMAFATQNKTFHQLEETSTRDLSIISEYCKQWRLKPSSAKTEVCCFHLNNREARKELKIQFEGVTLNHNHFPKYLGITLDRTLSYKSHLSNTAQKIKTRNNIIQKLAGSSWGADANCLRTSALSLVYSSAEYGAPVWLNSAHTTKVDCQLNTTMRIVSGTLKPTPVEWLPKLCNIAPPNLRRQHSLLKEFQKVQSNDELPLHEDIQNVPAKRLRSRSAPIALAKNLQLENFSIQDSWDDDWSSSGRSSPIFVEGNRSKEFELPRKEWCNLNRLRTATGRSNETLNKWGLTDDPSCPCGHSSQSTGHILTSCPQLSFKGSLEEINALTQDAVIWLKTLNL